MVGLPEALAVIWVSPETRFGWAGRHMLGLGQREPRQTIHCATGQAVGGWLPALRPWQPK